MILTQTWAMFVDAFRELHARKLFWITMGLSLLVVVIFALFSVDAKTGIHFAGWTIPGSEEQAARIPPSLFYTFWMIQVGINFWLAWVAAIIALISTAGIIPSLVSSGAIDTMLSKPMGRVRLFLTKYVTGLFFVSLQVGVFAIGCLLVIGLRTGDWEWRILLAIPLVTLFFSYLFSICALVGLISKSPLTSVLITGLLWFLIFLANMSDGILLGVKSQMAYEAEYAAAQMEYQSNQIAELVIRLEEEEAAGDAGDSRTSKRLDNARSSLANAEERAEDASKDLPAIEKWHGYVFGAKTVLPKTGETIALLERWMIDTSDYNELFPGMLEAEEVRFDDDDADAPADPSKVRSPQQRSTDEIRARSTGWVIGTSVIFELIILGICCWIFKRRDF